MKRNTPAGGDLTCISGLVAGLLLIGTPRLAAAQGCSMMVPEGGTEAVCTCEAGGVQFDMSRIDIDADSLATRIPNPPIPHIIAEGECSGLSTTYCQGSTVHQLGICENMPGVDASGGASGCLTTTVSAGFRVDTRTTCPPSNTCGCFNLSPTQGPTAPAVTAIGSQEAGGDWGVRLTYTSTSFSPAVITTVDIICDPSATDNVGLGPDSNPLVDDGGVNDCGVAWCSADIVYRTSAICPAGCVHLQHRAIAY